MGIVIGGIYKHFKKGDLYKVTAIAYHHQDGDELPVVIYHRCDENGIFQSIRNMPDNETNPDKAIIVKQPFWRLEEDFHELVPNPDRSSPIKVVQRFEYVK